MLCRPSLRRHYHPPNHQRPILHQRIEMAARDGDMAEVRRLLAEADSAVLPRGPSIGQMAFTGFVAYSLWNFTASAYDYSVTSAEAKSIMEGGASGAEVNMHLKSFRLKGEVRSKAIGSEEEERKYVWVIPHFYVTVAIFGRTSWVLTCRKRDGNTEWSTNSGAMSARSSGWPPVSGV